MIKHFLAFTKSGPTSREAKKYKQLFNEMDYLLVHSDVCEAVTQRLFKSGEEHFQLHGFEERRFPGFSGFDPDRYLRKNPDIARLIVGDRREFAKMHFQAIGLKDGRPY